MNLPRLSGMFARALERSRQTDDWVADKRDFEARVDGLACRARCRLELIVSFAEGSRHMTGDAIVQILTVEGVRVECLPGHIHFAARDTAIVDPAPLFALAAAEAAANLRGNGAFRSHRERREIGSAISAPAATRKTARL